ncbi:hypothetical protein C900_00588 [Fulvivirga imtechensis AK7]|uniref:Uncharacterized protein n=1 Tax=Fulvivirga imtechensis AK7 TaxID=1237149 RepID=L8JL89_9BACT|nr:hypothetical protein [Fulvivirga imtechensis]ELR68234.1 hypothetical protein C900_00588 [Fulvivirga imtechensis AK7]
MVRTTYLPVIFFLILASCINGKKQATRYDYQSISEAKLPAPVEYSFSADSTYVLALNEKKGTPKHPQNNIRYLVHDLTTNKLVLEDGLDNGSVSFHSDHELKIVLIPGIMKADQSLDDHTYIYDLRTKEKRLLSQQ